MREFWLGLALCSLMLLQGCAQNTVPLIYTTSAETSLPAGKAPVVALVPFTDARLTPDIGKRANGTDFVPNSNVSNWVTHAMGAELNRSGIVVVAMPSREQAFAAGMNYVMSGSVDEVLLTEISTIEYYARIHASVRLESRKKSLLTRSFTSVLSKKLPPTPGAPESVLSETLRDLIMPIVKAVTEKLRS